MLMTATVREVRPSGLLVRDRATGQDVFVHTGHARRYRPGDRIAIVFNGVMTNSLPPQINAIFIRRLQAAVPADRPSVRSHSRKVRANRLGPFFARKILLYLYAVVVACFDRKEITVATDNLRLCSRIESSKEWRQTEDRFAGIRRAAQDPVRRGRMVTALDVCRKMCYTLYIVISTHCWFCNKRFQDFDNGRREQTSVI